MLVLGLKEGQDVVLYAGSEEVARVRILRAGRGKNTRVGFDAGPEIRVVRGELECDTPPTTTSTTPATRKRR